jgi:hypothetical protein
VIVVSKPRFLAMFWSQTQFALLYATFPVSLFVLIHLTRSAADAPSSGDVTKAKTNVSSGFSSPGHRT